MALISVPDARNLAAIVAAEFVQLRRDTDLIAGADQLVLLSLVEANCR